MDDCFMPLLAPFVTTRRPNGGFGFRPHREIRMAGKNCPPKGKKSKAKSKAKPKGSKKGMTY